MALLMFDGFESAPVLRNGGSWSGSAPSAAPGRDGVGKAIQPYGSFDVKVPFPPASPCIIGIAVNQSATYFGNQLLQLAGDGGSTTHITVNFDATGHLVAKRSGGAGALLGTAPTPVAGGTWHWIEMKVTIADAGGIFILKLDGVEQINFTGDTRNAGTSTSLNAIILNGTGGGWPSLYDDLVVCDTTGPAPYNDFFGERVVRATRPVGNGALSQLVGSDGNSIDNYALVDEYPLGTTDYVASATPGEHDTYDCSAVTGLTSIDAVQVAVYAAKTDAGERGIKTLVRSAGGTLTASGPVPLSTTVTLVQGALRTTDADGTAWSPATVNSHEYGVEVV